VAFVALTASVEEPPLEIDVGLEVMLTVGAGSVLDLTVRLMVV
jgi:hypothetical protein